MYFSYNDKTKIAIISLKVKAGARITSIDGFIDINGTYILKISIKAAPEDGKANIAIIKMLADKWRLKQNQLEIIKGGTSNLKLLAVKNIEKYDMEDIVKMV